MTLLKGAGKALADVIPGLGRLTFDADTGTIFITSSTGVVGYRVALLLLNAGYTNVRVGMWEGDTQTENINNDCDATVAAQIKAILVQKGAHIVHLDWNDEATFGPALDGVKTVFCTFPHIANWGDIFTNFLLVCKSKKIEHFVKLSFFKTEQVDNPYRKNVPFVRFHGGCDDILQQAPLDSRISYTILCCTHLMPTPLLSQGKMLAEEHKFVTASYGMGVNYISPNDVADAALAALLDRKAHRNKVYNLSGPRPPITDADVAKLLTEFYGTRITHVQLGYHEYAADIKRRGLPDWLIKDSAELERIKASGIDEQASSYTKDLEKLIGRQPESFRNYLRNRSTMRPGLTFPPKLVGSNNNENVP